jgi:catechol 2,3-dioxygenase-like lactoylglutathione lyase family enzyme
MISGGNVTVYVSNMDAAVRFYTEAFGLSLTNRFGDRWATVQAGPSYWTTDEVGAGLVIGLHPRSPKHPAPGTKGAVGFGLETYAPIENVMARLAEHGVRITGDIIRYEAGNVVALADHDGNPTYVNEFPPDMVPESDLGARDGATDRAGSAMVSGGHAIVFVSDMDAAVRFYTEVLGLKLTNRYDNHLATVEAGRTLVIALHPRTPNIPAPPGTKGSMALGLAIDEPIDGVVSRLSKRGVRMTGEIDRSGRGALVELEDLDGNDLYLWENEAPAPEAQPEAEKQLAE